MIRRTVNDSCLFNIYLYFSFLTKRIEGRRKRRRRGSKRRGKGREEEGERREKKRKKE